MTLKETKKLALGAYRIYWKSGGSSIATIGCTDGGARWMAPCNWTCRDGASPGTSKPETWRDVESVVVIKTMPAGVGT